MNLLIWIAAIATDFYKVGIVLFAISTLIIGLVAGLKKVFLKNKKKFLLYFLVTLLLFAGTAFLTTEKILYDQPLHSFIACQVIFLFLGLLHVKAFRRYLPDFYKSPFHFWTEFLYTLVVTMMGLITYMMVVGIYKPKYQYIFTGSAICFIIPFLIVKLYEFAVSVPIPVYKKWYYPVHKNLKDPKEEELENPLVISFKISKEKQSHELNNFKLKAPEKMEFGKLFYFFINDYNDRHPNNEIEFLDNQGLPVGWIFYTKPKWYGVQKHIDVDRTIESNRIEENEIIICSRT